MLLHGGRSFEGAGIAASDRHRTHSRHRCRIRTASVRDDAHITIHSPGLRSDASRNASIAMGLYRLRDMPNGLSRQSPCPSALDAGPVTADRNVRAPRGKSHRKSV
ncbi:hypothetical protein [Lysobacter gummosus]|uniref:hypothetical protein n=1 Tax=Lysobacter gummosus TaxID=262324 RepID=UPI0036282D60